MRGTPARGGGGVFTQRVRVEVEARPSSGLETRHPGQYVDIQFSVEITPS